MIKLFFPAIFPFLFTTATAQEDTTVRTVFRNLLSDAQNNFLTYRGDKHYSGGKNYYCKIGFRGDRESIIVDTSSLGHTYFASSFDYSANREDVRISRLLTNLIEVIKDLTGSGGYRYTLYVAGDNNLVVNEKKKKKEKDPDKNDLNRFLLEKEKRIELDVSDLNGKRVIRITNSEKDNYNLKTLHIFIYAKSWEKD